MVFRVMHPPVYMYSPAQHLDCACDTHIVSMWWYLSSRGLMTKMPLAHFIFLSYPDFLVLNLHSVSYYIKPSLPGGGSKMDYQFNNTSLTYKHLCDVTGFEPETCLGRVHGSPVVGYILYSVPNSRPTSRIKHWFSYWIEGLNAPAEYA